MRIYVCVKHVPDTAANIKIINDTGYDNQVKYVTNPYDEYGVEEAVSLVEKNGEGEVIVAINTDKDAPIFGKSDYGIIGDLFEVVPALTSELGKLE